MTITEKKSTAGRSIKAAREGVTRVMDSVVETDREFELEPCLLDLVRLRVVQMYKCECTLNAQTKRLKILGETSHRLRSLPDWRNQTIFSDREKAALNLAEALTLNQADSVREEVIHVMRLVFPEHEVVYVVAAILAVNDWFQTNGRQ